MHEAFLQIHARFDEDQHERQLYGADVVDAYMDLANMQQVVQRRLPHLVGAQHARVLYRVLGLADRGRGLHG